MIDFVSAKLKLIASLASCKVLIYAKHGFVEWHDDVVKLGADNSFSWDAQFTIHQLFLRQENGLLFRHMPLLSNLVISFFCCVTILLQAGILSSLDLLSFV